MMVMRTAFNEDEEEDAFCDGRRPLSLVLSISCFQESETSEDETEDETDSESGSDSDV